MKQYYNISIYCNIYYCNTIQYGLKEISIYCTLQYIAIYCNVCYLNVINAQSLHHENDWASKNLDHTLQFLMLLYGYTGCIFFTLLPKPIFSGVAKVGNGWAQAQPIISSAQPIFMSIVQPIYAPFHIKNSLYNTQITHFEFFVVVCVGYF